MKKQMVRTKDKEILQKLDDFLNAFDVEELIRDGVQLLKFRFEKNNKRYEESFTINQFKQERIKKCKN